MRSLPVLAFLLLVNAAHATDCPPDAKSCKVITLTPDEEQVLIAPRMILDTAATGRQIDLGGVIAYFRNKIATAPAGEVKAEPPKEVPK